MDELAEDDEEEVEEEDDSDELVVLSEAEVLLASAPRMAAKSSPPLGAYELEVLEELEDDELDTVVGPLVLELDEELELAASLPLSMAPMMPDMASDVWEASAAEVVLEALSVEEDPEEPVSSPPWPMV